MEMNSIINLYEIPVRALRPETRGKLSCMLNRPKVLLSPQKHPRDYRGLADLMGITIFSNWFPVDDYVQKLLILWEDVERERSNLGTLQEYFGLIDRFDVLDDTFDMFLDDAKKYRDHLPSGPSLIPEELILKGDADCFEIGQVSPTYYDAFVLYVDADEEYAKTLIAFMEAPPSNLHLCDKYRGLVPGEIESCAILKLITESCRTLLVILSNELLQSSLHISFIQIARQMTYQKGRLRRVIPCTYKDCHLTDEWRAYHLLDHRRYESRENFRDKLRLAIKSDKDPPVKQSPLLTCYPLPPLTCSSSPDSTDVVPFNSAGLATDEQHKRNAVETSETSMSNNLSNSVYVALSRLFPFRKRKKNSKRTVLKA